MLRYTALYLFIGGLMALSLKRWFLALCGLVFLTVLMQHPSMPREMAGIQGLNPWNATFLVIVASWIMTRRNDPARAATSQTVLLIFGLYAAVLILTGFVAITDAHAIRGVGAPRLTARDVFIETVVNPLKLLLIGIMFFDGATTRLRVKQAIWTAVGSGFCYAALMYKTMKLGIFTMDYTAARRATDKLIGLYANDMAKVLAFVLWAGLVAVLIIRRPSVRVLWLMALASVGPAFLALKSRAGFLAFCVTGFMLGVVKWRPILVAAPIVVAIIIGFAPDVAGRMMTGVGTQHDGENDWDAISAGRMTYIWPAALGVIADSPVFGHGRYAILRTGAFDQILDSEGRVPTHPHNSYLETLLDSGAIGLGICLAASFGIMRSSWLLLRKSNDQLFVVIGALGFIAIVTELTCGLTGSSFYPTQSSVPFLCVWGVCLRLRAEQTARVAATKRASLAFAMQTPALEPVLASALGGGA